MSLKCNNCGSTQLQRVPREGFVQMHLLPFFGFYPWRCIGCGQTKYSGHRTDPSLAPPVRRRD